MTTTFYSGYGSYLPYILWFCSGPLFLTGIIKPPKHMIFAPGGLHIILCVGEFLEFLEHHACIFI